MGKESTSDSRTADSKHPWAHYYDLLELPVFESDTKKIHAAVLARNKELRAKALHPSPQEARQVQERLNEIGRASATLENAEAKAQYDRELQGNLDGTGEADSFKTGQSHPPSPPENGRLAERHAHPPGEHAGTHEADAGAGLSHRRSLVLLPLGLVAMTGLCGVLFIRGNQEASRARTKQETLVRQGGELDALRERLTALESAHRELKQLRIREKDALDRYRREEAQRPSTLEDELREARSSNARNEEALQQAKEELRKLQKEFDLYKAKYRVSKRTNAPGARLGDLTTLDGARYVDAEIKKISEAYMIIGHSNGSRRLDFRNLPESLQEEYVFSPEAAARERVAEERLEEKKAEMKTVNDAKAKREGLKAQLDSCLRRIEGLNRENMILNTRIRSVQASRLSKGDKAKQIGSLNSDQARNNTRINSLRNEANGLRQALR